MQKKDAVWIVAGCIPMMTRKIGKDAFAEAGCSIDTPVHEIDLRNMPTDESTPRSENQKE